MSTQEKLVDSNNSISNDKVRRNCDNLEKVTVTTQEVIAEKKITISRSSDAGSGLFIDCRLCSVNIPLLLDTGASKTIISKEAYNCIPEEVRPPVLRDEACPKLELADGTPLETLGCVLAPIELGGVKVEHGVIVAAIKDPGILGLDFLKKHNCQVDLGTGSLTIMGQQVSGVGISATRVHKVSVQDEWLVPGRSEVIVPGFTDTCLEVSEILVGASFPFEEKHQLKVAATLSDCSDGQVEVPVRILNPNDEDVLIHRGTVVGQAEAVKEVVSILQTEKENVEALRKVEIQQCKTNESSRPDDSIGHINSEGHLDVKIPDHLANLYESGCENLTESERIQYCNLLMRYQSAFAKDNLDLGQTDIVEHTIETGDAAPIKQRARRTPLAFKGEEEKEVKKMLEKGVIRESTSPWASPVVLVKKRDSTTRFCIDYRKLNAVTKFDSYPLPRIADCFDALGGSKLFSVMDLASGYWQIKVKKEDQAKTAFVTKSGLYEFSVLPFGLTTAPSTFERCMETILRGLQWQTCLVYLDDVIVFSKTFEEHLKRLDDVLRRIKDAGLKLKPSKCSFIQSRVSFLGHVVSVNGLETDPEKTKAVQNWSQPKDVTQVRAFLGFCSYYRRFIENFAKVAHPLTQLTCKDKKFEWTLECQEAFETLKKKLSASPIMALPTDDDPFVLDVDASNYGIGGVLSQIQEGNERVISFASRTLNKAEYNYCVTRKELLAIVFFIKHFRHYLLGRKFVVRSDHQPLKWLFSLKDPSGQVARWLEFLSEYNFIIEYRPGSKHSNADGMSRSVCDPRDCNCQPELPCGPCTKCKRKTELMNPVITRINTRSNTQAQTETESRDFTQYSSQQLKKFQEQDPNLSPVLLWKAECPQRPKADTIVTRSPETRNLWLSWEVLKTRNGILYKQSNNGELRFIVPQNLRSEVLKLMHNTLLSAHLGYKKTLNRLSKHYYWYHMKEDVYDWVQKCTVCGANRRTPLKPKAPLGDLRIGAPMDRIGVDLLGPLPVTPRGNKYIMVAQDYFSKWVEVYAIPDGTAETCANVLVNEFLSRFGMPLSIHTDQGRNFESELFKGMCTLLGIHKTRTSPYRPACNGLVERFNSTLIKMIKAFLDGKQVNWDLNLGCLAGAYRSSQNESTKYSPNMLMLGRQTRAPADIVFGDPPQQETSSLGDYVYQLKLDLQKSYEITRTNLKQAAQHQKSNYDVKLATNTYKPGDVVWFLDESRTPKKCPKLQNLWQGPNIVIAKTSDLNYKILFNKKGKQRLVHHNKLKPYLGNKPNWVKSLSKNIEEKQTLGSQV